MMESTNSCTNLSGSKLNLLTAHGTMACRKGAPGMSACCFNQASSRPAIPSALGIPPTPGGRSSTRLLSVTANWPRRKNASRGSVATQFGLPRPAFRYDKEFSSAVFDATFWTKSLISNGPSLSNSFSFAVSDNGRLRRLPCPLVFAAREGLLFVVIVSLLLNHFRKMCSHDSNMMMTMPQIVSRVLPTAKGTLQPRAGIWLLAWSQTRPSDAVVVRDPEMIPRFSASWKRNTYLATNMPRIRGTVVASAPHRKRPTPCVFRPLTKPGPAEMPTMAMKMLRPTEFMNQTVGVGMRPKD